MYYTIRHSDTHEPLGMGGPLDRGKAVSILTMRKNLARSEWYVTGWEGDGSDNDEIVFSVSADEFVDCGGKVTL